MIYTVWIINKAGGLVYHHTFAPFHAPLTSNDLLILASTFQSVHSISCRMIGKGSGIKSVICSSSSNSYKLACLSTPTGIKFLLTCDVAQSNVEDVLQRIYVDYADWVMKNITYTPEMPIRIPAFDQALTWINKANAVLSK